MSERLSAQTRPSTRGGCLTYVRVGRSLYRGSALAKQVGVRDVCASGRRRKQQNLRVEARQLFFLDQQPDQSQDHPLQYLCIFPLSYKRAAIDCLA